MLDTAGRSPLFIMRRGDLPANPKLQSKKQNDIKSPYPPDSHQGKADCKELYVSKLEVVHLLQTPLPSPTDDAP